MPVKKASSSFRSDVNRFADLKFDPPTSGVAIHYFLSDPKVQAGVPLSGLLDLWVPTRSIDRAANPKLTLGRRDAVAGELTGSLKMMQRINARPTFCRTAALLNACETEGEKRILLKLAALRVVRMAHPDLGSEMRDVTLSLLSSLSSSS
ncbi:hypothetical protein ACOI1H_23965, partial [Loktanella sp. DJP18]|uniref:hypothetical protein n=1 Tax=Loktanella sp. DJP18 TaxID=3409788 RepID=UPI003BB7A54D